MHHRCSAKHQLRYGGGEVVNVFAELDTDQDGLTDFYEKNLASFYAPLGQVIGTYTGNSDPLVSDTDEDGIADGWEVLMGLDPANRGCRRRP